ARRDRRLTHSAHVERTIGALWKNGEIVKGSWQADCSLRLTIPPVGSRCISPDLLVGQDLVIPFSDPPANCHGLKRRSKTDSATHTHTREPSCLPILPQGPATPNFGRT